MQIQLPPHVARALGVNDNHERDLVIKGVQLLDHEVGPLFSDGAKAVFNSLLDSLPLTASVEVVDCSTEIANWRYRIIECDGVLCARVVEVPFTWDASRKAPPTDVESLLVQAWLSSDRITDEKDCLRKNIVVFEWLPKVPEATKSVTRALSGVVPRGSSNQTTRSWSDAGLVALKTTSRLLQHNDGELLRRLFGESATEQAPRWRFLSLYRILEHGYLENVFKDLASRFFSEPKESLDSATNALKSEVEQFVRLVDLNSLKSHFEEICRINDSLTASGNQFAILLEREAKKRSTYQEAFKRGVALCYQTRCSIVHAGSHSVVFDKSPGGDTALLAFLPEMEKAAAQFLGIQTS